MKMIGMIAAVALLMVCTFGIVKGRIANDDEIAKDLVLVEIEVYVNDIKIDTPVYKDLEAPKVSGPYNLSDYVLLEAVCTALGDVANIKIPKSKTMEINNGVYVPFSSIRYAIDGSLKQDDEKSMYLYTKDFERLDIPLTLEECYQALDQMLSNETRQDIKKSDTLIEYHFDLGMWIRNNWIYPTEGRIAKTLRDTGINDPDGMSSEILQGYQHYLNSTSTE